MSEGYLGEIRMVGFNFAPRDWALCKGQLLPINQNQSLFSILGTIYGGDGRTTFALPEMRGRAPVHVGTLQNTNFTQGLKTGLETVILRTEDIPSHRHTVRASNADGTVATPVNSYLAKPSNAASLYSSSTDTGQMAPLRNTGGGQAHNNMQPYLVINFVICLRGLFPSRN